MKSRVSIVTSFALEIGNLILAVKEFTPPPCTHNDNPTASSLHIRSLTSSGRIPELATATGVDEREP